MRALLDTNIILDLFLERPAFVRDAEAIWEANRLGQFECYVSALTPTTIFYVGRKTKGEAARRYALAGLLTKFQVCAVDHATLQAAISLPIEDYEDAVQVVNALTYGLDAIVTRDPQDFAGATLPVHVPRRFPLAVITAIAHGWQ